LQLVPDGRDLEMVALAELPLVGPGDQSHPATDDLERGGAGRLVLSQALAGPQRQQRLLERDAGAGHQGQGGPAGGGRGRLLQQLGGRGGEITDLDHRYFLARPWRRQTTAALAVRAPMPNSWRGRCAV